MKAHDVSSLRYLFLGRRAARRADRALGGRFAGRGDRRQLLADRERLADLSAQLGIAETPRKFGSPSFPVWLRRQATP
jgi:hypothetical protein